MAEDNWGARPLYNMDEDYIENKYVKAEEERLRKEKADRERREKEEALALVRAEEQQRKAEIERKRLKEEEEAKEKLEQAKQMREEAERKRKQKQKDMQTALDNIQEELKNLEIERSKILTDKLAMSRAINDEEAEIKNELDEISVEKAKILERERKAKRRMEEFERESDNKKQAQEVKEKANESRAKELAVQRRDVQNDMLNFLKDPEKFLQDEMRRNQPVEAAPSTYTPPKPSPEPMQVNKAPNYPTFQEQPFQQPNTFSQPQSFPSNAPENNIVEQIALLNSFLESGAFTMAEYEESRKAAIEESKKKHPGVDIDAILRNNGMGQAPQQTSPQFVGGGAQKEVPVVPAVVEQTNGGGNVNTNSVESQLKNLGDLYNTGALTSDDYEDARNKILADAGLMAGASSGNSTSSPQPSAQPQSPPYATTFNPNEKLTTVVPMGSVNNGRQQRYLVQVPNDWKPGEKLKFFVNGGWFFVFVPNGITAGGTFMADV